MSRAKPRIIEEVGFDFGWDERKVWKLNHQAEKMQLRELEWHFKIPFWNKPNGGYYDLTPNEVLYDPIKFKEEYTRVENADLKHPIDIMMNKGRWLILDGLHRLVKAKTLGMTSVNVRKIPREDIPKILK